MALGASRADARTRGLIIEDTHISGPEKRDTLLVVVALAVTWVYPCATRAMGRPAIPRKPPRPALFYSGGPASPGDIPSSFITSFDRSAAASRRGGRQASVRSTSKRCEGA